MSKDLAMQNNENQLWDLHQEEGLNPIEFTEQNAVNITGVEVTVQQQALNGLKVYLMERDVLDQEFDLLTKEEITAENVPKFKALRLKYVKNRTQGVNKWHENEKEVSLRYTQFLDAKKRSENAINESREEKLLEGEKFFENQEKEKKRLLNLERIEKIKPYVAETTNLDFSEMNDYDFEDYVLGKKTRFENEDKAKKEAEELAEKNRLAEIEKQKQIAIENAKLKKEAEARAKQYEKERAILEAEKKAIADKAEKERKIEAEKQAKIQAEKDAEIKKQREAKEKLEAEAKALRLKKEKEEADALDAADKLAKAPIKKQLKEWVKEFSIPESKIDHVTKKEIEEKFLAFKKWADTMIDIL